MPKYMQNFWKWTKVENDPGSTGYPGYTRSCQKLKIGNEAFQQVIKVKNTFSFLLFSANQIPEFFYGQFLHGQK